MKDFIIIREFSDRFGFGKEWVYHILLRKPIYLIDLSLVIEKFGYNIIDILKDNIRSGKILTNKTLTEIIVDEFKNKGKQKFKIGISIRFKKEYRKKFSKPVKFKKLTKTPISRIWIDCIHPGDTIFKDSYNSDISRNKNISKLFPELKNIHSDKFLEIIKEYIKTHYIKNKGIIISNECIQLILALF